MSARPGFSVSRRLALALVVSSLAGCRGKPSPADTTGSNAAPAAEAISEVVRVAIGTQDTTINCATGGPLVRELHLLEKYLPHDGKYAHVKYDIHWENQPTGAQLNS